MMTFEAGSVAKFDRELAPWVVPPDADPVLAIIDAHGGVTNATVQSSGGALWYGIATLPAVPGPALAEWTASKGGKPLVARTLFIIQQTRRLP